MKYSKKFNRDYDWYLAVSDTFNFDGVKDYYSKKGDPLIVSSEKGVSAKKSFYLWDSQGKILPTNEPDLLFKLLKTKGSVNLHIKMYAEDLVKGLLSMLEIYHLKQEFNFPEWVVKAIVKQAKKIHKNGST